MNTIGINREAMLLLGLMSSNESGPEVLKWFSDVPPNQEFVEVEARELICTFIEAVLHAEDQGLKGDDEVLFDVIDRGSDSPAYVPSKIGMGLVQELLECRPGLEKMTRPTVH